MVESQKLRDFGNNGKLLCYHPQGWRDGKRKLMVQVEPRIWAYLVGTKIREKCASLWRESGTQKPGTLGKLSHHHKPFPNHPFHLLPVLSIHQKHPNTHWHGSMRRIQETFRDRALGKPSVSEELCVFRVTGTWIMLIYWSPHVFPLLVITWRGQRATDLHSKLCLLLLGNFEWVIQLLWLLPKYWYFQGSLRYFYCHSKLTPNSYMSRFDVFPEFL